MLGGGPVGVELGQMLARYGARSRSSSPPRLLVRENASRRRAAAAAAPSRTASTCAWGTRPSRSRPSGDGVAVTLDGGDRVTRRASRRRDRPHAAHATASASTRSASSRATRASRSTSSAGRPRACGPSATSPASRRSPTSPATRRASRAPTSSTTTAGPPTTGRPARVFTDPEVAAVGLSEAEARDRASTCSPRTVDLSDVARTETYGKEPRGHLGVLADTDRRSSSAPGRSGR